MSGVTGALPADVLRAQLHELVDGLPNEYRALREMAEHILDQWPSEQRPRSAACDATQRFLDVHCEDCGVLCSDDDWDMIVELELLRVGVTDISDLDLDYRYQTCVACYHRRIAPEATSWLKELQARDHLWPIVYESVIHRTGDILPTRYDHDTASPAHAAFYALLNEYDRVERMVDVQQRQAVMHGLAAAAQAGVTNASLPPDLHAGYAWLATLAHTRSDPRLPSAPAALVM